jgi:ankyrin repeat protein
VNIDEKAVFELLRQINAQDPLKGSTPLMHAIEFNNSLKLIEALYQAGAKLDTQDFVGDSALHFAAREGRADVVKFLLDCGANKNLVNAEKKKPIDLADSPEIKQLLS